MPYSSNLLLPSSSAGTRRRTRIFFGKVTVEQMSSLILVPTERNGLQEWRNISIRYPAARANFGHPLLLSVDRTPVSGLKASCVLYPAAPNGHLSITAMRISRLTVKRRDEHDFPDSTNRQHPSGRNSTSIVFASNHRVAVRQDDRRCSLRWTYERFQFGKADYLPTNK